MAIACNEIPSYSAYLKQKFASCKRLEAADMDLLVDLMEAIRLCGSTNTIGLNNTILSGDIYWIEDLDFGSTPITYVWLGALNTAPIRRPITLSPSDSTYDRIDVFAVDVVTNTVVVIEGTPSGNPLEPNVNFERQLRINSAYIPAGATAPLIDQTSIYNEYLGEPLEWKATAHNPSSGSTIVLNSTNYQASSGVTCIELKGIYNEEGVDFSSTTPISYSGFEYLLFDINLVDASKPFYIRISFNDSIGSPSHQAVKFLYTGNNGFDLNKRGWQTIALHKQDDFFNGSWGSLIPFGNIRIDFVGIGSGMHENNLILLDHVRLTDTAPTPSGPLRWLDLIDTDNTYANKEGFIPQVNRDASGLNLVDSEQFLNVRDVVRGNYVFDGSYTHINNFTWFFQASKWIINDVLTNLTISDNITLAPSHPSLNRFDAVVVNSNNTISVIEGTPSASPTTPPIGELQALISYILVEHATVEPTYINNNLIYDKNEQEVGGEWNTSLIYGANQGVVNFQSTDRSFPSNGDVSIRTFTDIGDVQVGFSLDTSIPVTVTDHKFIFRIYHDDNLIAWPSTIYLNFIDGSTGEGFLYNILDGQYGYDVSQSRSWNTIIVPLSEIGMAGKKFDIITMRTISYGTRYYDLITLQGGLNSVGGIIPDYTLGQESIGNDVSLYKNGILSSSISISPGGGTPTGLEALNEGNGIGWRLIGRHAPAFGNIGQDATDLSYSISTDSVYGATGNWSFAANDHVGASGLASFGTGSDTKAKGDYSLVGNRGAESQSFAETALGSYNTIYTPNSLTAFNATDRLFVLGNGLGVSNRHDAFTVLKNAQVGIDIDNFQIATTGEKLQVNGSGKFSGTLKIGAYTLPNIDGIAGQRLETDGNGVVSWVNASSIGAMYSKAKVITDATYTVLADDTQIINGTACVYTLPSAASSNGRILNFTGVDTSFNVSIFKVNSISGIDEIPALTHFDAGQTVVIQSNGVNWYAVNNAYTSS